MLRTDSTNLSDLKIQTDEIIGLITVTVINTDVKVESKYDRHVLVAEFTGASCAFCPEGFDNMSLQLSKPAMAAYKANLHIAAFHSEEMGKDSLAIAATMDLKSMFPGLDLPSYTIDFRDAGGLHFRTTLLIAESQYRHPFPLTVSLRKFR